MGRRWHCYPGVIVHYQHRHPDADEMGFRKGSDTEFMPPKTGVIHIPIPFEAGLGNELFGAAYQAVIGRPAPSGPCEDEWRFCITRVEGEIRIAVSVEETEANG